MFTVRPHVPPLGAQSGASPATHTFLQKDEKNKSDFGGRFKDGQGSHSSSRAARVMRTPRSYVAAFACPDGDVHLVFHQPCSSHRLSALLSTLTPASSSILGCRTPTGDKPPCACLSACLFSSSCLSLSSSTAGFCRKNYYRVRVSPSSPAAPSRHHQC